MQSEYDKLQPLLLYTGTLAHWHCQNEMARLTRGHKLSITGLQSDEGESAYNIMRDLLMSASTLVRRRLYVMLGNMYIGERVGMHLGNWKVSVHEIM